jgi:hypothetical protein
MTNGLRKFNLLPGQLLGVTLIGLLLLSALVYYKSVKAQRYLEPTLAIAKPRIMFIRKLGAMIEKEFGKEKIGRVAFTANSIIVDEALLFKDPDEKKMPDQVFMKQLSRIFVSLLQDAALRTQFDIILVSTRLPVSPHLEMNKKRRKEMQRIAELILFSLYGVEEKLEREYGMYFAAAAVPAEPLKSSKWVEFKIIPSEHLHVEMIKSVGKYY